MSKRPCLIVFEYEIDDDIPNQDADRVARAAFDRACLPPGQTVEGRSGEAP